jgi:hypothetical protein
MIQVFAFNPDSNDSLALNVLIDSVKENPNLEFTLVDGNILHLNNFNLDRQVFHMFLQLKAEFALILKEIPEDPGRILSKLSSFDTNEEIDFIQFDMTQQGLFLDRRRFRYTKEYRHVFLNWMLSLRIIELADSILALTPIRKSPAVKNLRERRLRVLTRSRAVVNFGRKNFSGSLFVPGQIEEKCTQYLISKKCAASLVGFNNELLLSSDMVYLGVSRAGNFRTGRIC